MSGKSSHITALIILQKRMNAYEFLPFVLNFQNVLLTQNLMIYTFVCVREDMKWMKIITV